MVDIIHLLFFLLSVFLWTPFTSQHSYLSVFHFLWKVTKDIRNSLFQNIKYLLVWSENLISRRPWYTYTHRDKGKKETQVELHFITVTLKQKNQRISPAAARRQTGEAWRGDNLNLHGCLHKCHFSVSTPAAFSTSAALPLNKLINIVPRH